MSPYDHYEQAKRMADYGRKPALIASIAVHVLAIGCLFVFAGHEPKKDDFGKAIEVQLGGPQNMNMGGKQRKAPTAGVSKPKPKPKATRKKTTPPPKKKAKPKPAKNQVGLNRNKKKPPPKETKATEEAEVDRTGDRDPTPVPTPSNTVDNRASGNVRDGDGSGVELEFGDGSKITNIDDLQFRSYLASIQSAISRRWIDSATVNGTARIFFTIQRDGSITNVTVERSSGYPYLDGAARRAVLGADLPPLPQGFKEEELNIAMNFRYGKK